jgi:WD40 repeat protein/glutaredoxin-related protein
MIQLKTVNPGSVLPAFLGGDKFVLFVNRRKDGVLTSASRKALTLIESSAELCASVVEVQPSTSLESALFKYSGWRYLPQLYFGNEFIGGSLVIEEFIDSCEHARVLGIEIHRARRSESKVRSVWKIDTNPTKDYILVARADGTATIVETSSRNTVLHSECHPGWVNSARFDADGQCFYTAGTDTAFSCWDLDGNLVNSRVSAHSRWINDIAVHPNSEYVATVGADKIIRFWRPVELGLISELGGHQHSIWCALATMSMFVSGDESGAISIAGGAGVELQAVVKAHQGTITCLAPTCDPSVFCSCGYDGMAALWDFRGFKQSEYRGHHERVWCICQLGDGDMFATGSADRTVHIWGASSGAVIRIVEYRSHPLSLCYVRRLNHLVVGLADGTLSWIDLGAEGHD